MNNRGEKPDSSNSTDAVILEVLHEDVGNILSAVAIQNVIGRATRPVKSVARTELALIIVFAIVAIALGLPSAVSGALASARVIAEVIGPYATPVDALQYAMVVVVVAVLVVTDPIRGSVSRNPPDDKLPGRAG